VGESEAAVARGEGESEAAVARGEGESEAVVSGHVCCIELTVTVPSQLRCSEHLRTVFTVLSIRCSEHDAVNTMLSI
jgi:hypothetical protein